MQSESVSVDRVRGRVFRGIPEHSAYHFCNRAYRICTIASRFYKKCPDLYPKLSVYAKKLMFDVPSKGYKSVEVVQAYLILTCWCLGPEERFEQDRTWL